MRRPRIRSYQEAVDFLGGRQERKTGQKGTVVVRLTTTEIAVRYHRTDVVTYHHPATGKIATIHTGGWSTKTTVARINEYSPEGSWASSLYGDVWYEPPGNKGAPVLLTRLRPSFTLISTNQHATI